MFIHGFFLPAGIIRDLVAVINGTAFVYINNETDNTVWPGNLSFCLIMPYVLT